MTFAGAVLRKRWIDAAFLLPYHSKSPRFHKIETFGPKSHGHYLRIREAARIDDEVQTWLCEAYRVGVQEHSG